MSISFPRVGIWVLIAIFIFSIFRWLFGIAIPGAALEFSVGITIILLAGLLFGRYISRIWFKAGRRYQNGVLFVLILLILLCCFLIGLFVNKMIVHTQFIYFFFTVLLLFLVSALVAAIISLLRNRIRTNIQSTKTALAHTKSELQVLQSQLSPHFLFNTLNNLYGLSISDHHKVPNLILKLSELLRYSVYEVKDTFVSLQDEIAYLKNYIEFEKIRLGERLDLKLSFGNISDQSIKIAPMLLIVFVENAFKHPKDNQDERIFIEISLKILTGSIVFSVKNSCCQLETTSGLAKKHSGFGLESVRKRLDLLYENMHDLEIQQSDRLYTVNLILYYK